MSNINVVHPEIVPPHILVGEHDFIRQFFYSIGVTDRDYVYQLLRNDDARFEDPYTMKDMGKTVQIIQEAIAQKRRIVVFGDYDADGVTSTTLMTLGLRSLGANVYPRLPTRDEGYGISIEQVKELQELFTDEDFIIITVDNGIKAPEVATYCLNEDITFIVTDHHSVDYDHFPSDAVAVVNPQQIDCAYPNVDLPGVGVAYKVIQAIYMRTDGFSQSDADNFAWLCAIGIIADMMPIDSPENRAIFRQGMRQMRGDDCPLPILSMSEHPMYPIDRSRLTAEDIAFGIAPRINAAGRVENPKIALDFFLEEDEVESYKMARNLDDINDSRKQLQADMVDSISVALDEIAESMGENLSDTNIIIHVEEHAPQGLVGLAAGNLVERFGVPAIVLHAKGDLLVGSARSVPQLNIVDAIKSAEKYTVRFGGHAAAAGMSIAPHQFDDFRRKVIEYVNQELQGVTLGKTLHPTNLITDFSQISEQLYLDCVRILEPAQGATFPKATFMMENVEILSLKAWGKTKNHASFELLDSYGNYMKANAWRMGDYVKPFEKIEDVLYAKTLVFTMEIATYPNKHFRVAIEYIDICIENTP